MHKTTPSSRRRPGSISGVARWIPACAGMTMVLLLSLSAHAADYTYPPKDCEFLMDFPEEPSVTNICNPNNPKQCHDEATFKKIYDLESGITITATCTVAEKDMLSRYSGEVMQYTLGLMAKQHVDEDYQTALQEYKNARQAVVMGSKKQKDGREDIYMSQLWIGKKSVFTVEGTITGGMIKDADELFARIMKSARLANAPIPAENPTETPAAPQKERGPNP